jgi:hypothetical protein
MSKTPNKKISIIIPWRNATQQDRADIAEWCFEYYKTLFPKAEFIFSDSKDKAFSRGKSINKGVNRCTGDYIIITDADYIFSPELAKALVNDHDWTVAVKSENYFFLNKASTKKILEEDPSDFDFNESMANQGSTKSTFVMYGGILAMPKKNFIKFDPFFKNYGFEDNTFNLCMNAFYGKAFRTDYNLYHMNHDRIAESEYMQGSYTNKDYYDKVWKPLEYNIIEVKKLAKKMGLKK